MSLLPSLFYWQITAANLLLFLLKTQAKKTCQPIEIETCQDLPYDLTSMPNFVGNDEQSEADMQLATFLPLIQVQCSSKLKFFLCSLYVPMCTDKVEMTIGPCRPLCESVQKCCEPTLKQFGFAWPDSFNCSAFPAENNAQAMCMRGPSPPAVSGDACGGSRSLSQDGSPPLSPSHTFRPTPRDLNAHSLVESNFYQTIVPCDTKFFTSFQSNCASFVLFAMSLACFTSSCTLLTVGWLRSQRNVGGLCCNPRAAAFRNATYCYGLASTGPLMRLMLGRRMTACTGHLDALVTNGHHNVFCTAIAVLGFYFGAAAQLWLLIACILWLLSEPLKLDENLLNKQRFYMHMLSWMVPLVQTASVLAHQAVDADLCTGLCSVGNWNPDALLKFVILPQVVYFTGSSFVFLVGFYLRKCNEFHTNWTAPLHKQNTGHRCPEIQQKLLIFENGTYFFSSFCLLICNVLHFILIKNGHNFYASNWLSFSLVLLKISANFFFGLTLGVYYLFVAIVEICKTNPRNVMTSPLVSRIQKPSTRMRIYGKKQQNSKCQLTVI